MIQVNLNNYVKFLPNDLSRKIYKESFNHLPDSVKLKLMKELTVDDKGYARMQIHDFMNLFGPYMMMGHELPIDSMDVLFEPNVKQEELHVWPY